MELPVELNKTRQTAKIIFAGQHDFGFLAEWRKTLVDDKNPVRIDAVDFAQLAVYRFQAHSEILQPYAETIEDIGDHITNNPNCEVGGCVLLICDWFPESKVIGLMHFRRTWSNNIILDYLAAHPYITRPPNGYAQIVRGVGTALLYFLSTVAKQYGCDSIWGEATPISCGYYKHIFKLDSVEDLINVPSANFIAFVERFNNEGAKKEGAMADKSGALEKIYELEAKDPPFVGSKTAVFNPKRRLAYRFLDLPYHVQMAIAEALGLLQDDDKSQPAAEQFRRFFKRATDSGKLPDLWEEVEKKHPDGEPDKNPFPRS